MFAAINAARPDGVRYASTKLADDRATFVVLLELDGPANPLTAVPEFVEFQDELKTRLAGPPTVEQLHIVGTYRLFSD